MRRNVLTILIYALLAQGLSAQANIWHNITPLKSNRADVERLLGAGKERTYYGEVDYESEKKRITVNYAQKLCYRGWNVPKDTVISVAFWPSDSDANKSAKELNLVESKYFISGDDAFYGTWTDPEAGVQYYFMNMSQQLQRIKYIPTRKDNAQRCDGFPAYVPEAQYYPYESRLFYNPKAGKDGGMDYLVAGSLFNIVYQATESKGKYIPYVLVYFDDKLPYKPYQRRLAQFRLYANRMTTKMKYEKVQIIEGGMNQRNEVEFYLLPKEWRPPAPAPALPSPQFTTKKRLES
ncbi:MAG: hypothetical protein ABL999_10440 [Pyrinomonadaceae bacterium]